MSTIYYYPTSTGAGIASCERQDLVLLRHGPPVDHVRVSEHRTGLPERHGHWQVREPIEGDHARDIEPPGSGPSLDKCDVAGERAGYWPAPGR